MTNFKKFLAFIGKVVDTWPGMAILFLLTLLNTGIVVIAAFRIGWELTPMVIGMVILSLYTLDSFLFLWGNKKSKTRPSILPR